LPRLGRPNPKKKGRVENREEEQSAYARLEFTMNTDASKPALRRAILGVMKTIPPVDRTLASERARALLSAQPLWREARSILLYAPMAEELDVWPLLGQALAAGKTVGLPRFDPGAGRYLACQVRDPEQDIRIGHYGIREPAWHGAGFLLNRLDLILVPGVAFDLQGRRLGRGKGYYDQLLAALRGVTCGVAFDQQIVDAIPVVAHDVRVNCILTPTRWCSCGRGAVLE
jgi:5-formyltetrahydrofolate cyclo-ligase